MSEMNRNNTILSDKASEELLAQLNDNNRPEIIKTDLTEDIQSMDLDLRIAGENIISAGLSKYNLLFKDSGLGLEIKVRYVDAEVPRLKLIDKGDWVDVYAWEEVELKKDEIKAISLGFAMELPEGWEAHLAPRSSTLKKFGILCGNSFGVIDNSYAGDEDIWGFMAYAVRDTTIHKGDRIAQFRIIEKQPKLRFTEVAHLEKPNRGGFGSTGNGVL